MKKISLIISVIILLAIIIFGSYLFMVEKGIIIRNYGGEYTEEDIASLLSELKDTTGISFSETKKAKILWKTGEVRADWEVDSLGVDAIKNIDVKEENISEQILLSGSFFEARGFLKDLRNSTEGSEVGSVGYYKDNMVCRVAYQRNPAKKEEVKIQVYCGLVE